MATQHNTAPTQKELLTELLAAAELMHGAHADCVSRRTPRVVKGLPVLVHSVPGILDVIVAYVEIVHEMFDLCDAVVDYNKQLDGCSKVYLSIASENAFLRH